MATSSAAKASSKSSSNGKTTGKRSKGSAGASGNGASFLSDGAAYIDSLRDGRQVWWHGEQVDVTKHPAFGTSARVFGTIYDLYNDPDAKPVLVEDAKKGSNGVLTTYLAPQSSDDLLKIKAALERVHSSHLGFITQGPEYKGPMITALRGAASYFGDRADNVLAFCERITENRLYPANAFTDPQVDRSKRPSELSNPDLILRVVDERDDGIVVRGAKMVSTTAPFTNEILVLRYGGANRLTEADREYALIFSVPTGAKGLKIVAREMFRRPAPNPMDAPLSNLFEENDSILIFEDVFIPWENVFVYQDTERADNWLAQTNLALNLVWGDIVRWQTKFEFYSALAVKIAKANGTMGFRGQQEKLGELLAWTGLVKDLATAACANPDPYYDEVGVSHRTVGVFRGLRPMIYKRVMELAQEIAGSGVVPIPSSLADIEANPELNDFLQGATLDGTERARLYKLAWDAMHSDFASRHELFERLHTGNTGDVLVQLFFGAGGAQMDGLHDAQMAQLEALTKQVA